MTGSSRPRGGAALVAGGLLLPLLSSHESAFSVVRPSAGRQLGPRSSPVREAAGPSTEPCFARAICLSVGTAAAVAAAAGLRAQNGRCSRTALSAVAESVPGERRRREVSLAGLVAAIAPPGLSQVARAEVVGEAVKLQRAVVDVATDEKLEREVKFWTEGCLMKVLGDAKGPDGLRSVKVGFGDEKQGAFAVEIKVDPAVAKRAPMSFLNWSVMQPTQGALGSIQLCFPDQTNDMYARVQNSGGNVMIGDIHFMDCESPRGVQVRMVSREGKPQVELVMLNIEVPAFLDTTNFYKASCGLKEIDYDLKNEPPIQDLSALLESPMGGPKLLLSPIPDFRVRQRERDEFVGLLFTSPNAQKVAEQAESGVTFISQAKERRLQKLREEMLIKGEKPPEVMVLEGTQCNPSLERVGKTTRINDGVDNILVVMDTAEFQNSLA